MYGILTYIWLIFMVNVGKYTIHGSYGYGKMALNDSTYYVVNSTVYHFRSGSSLTLTAVSIPSLLLLPDFCTTKDSFF